MKDKNNQTLHEIPTNIGKPVLRALEHANMNFLEPLTSVSKNELLKLHGVGPKAVRILSDALAENGMSFASPDQSFDISSEANAKIQKRYGK